MFSRNEDDSMEMNSNRRTNIDHPDRSNNVTPNVGTEGGISNPLNSPENQCHQLREIDCNQQKCENLTHSPNRCCFSQDGTCKDPNCRSYWNIPLRGCFDKKENPKLSKENKETPKRSSDVQKIIATPSPGRNEKITPTKLLQTSFEDKLKSPSILKKPNEERLITPTLRNVLEKHQKVSQMGGKPRKRVSPINLLRTQKILEKDTVLNSSLRRIEKLGVTEEEVLPDDSFGMIPEIKSLERFLPRVSLVHYMKYLDSNGVQVQEIDIGQPCLGCESCKGYEAHSWRQETAIKEKNVAGPTHPPKPQRETEKNDFERIKFEIVPIEKKTRDGKSWRGPCIECVLVNCLYCKVFGDENEDLECFQSFLKNCRNCKCPRDNHAISEFAARSRIGFSSSNDTLDPRTIGYTFVPSGLTKANQVSQYYSLFPSHEVPKIGSEGEVNRSKRLVKQLPKQDLSLTVCKFVEGSHKGSYQDFIQARNEIALDIGYVKPAPCSSTCEYCEKIIPVGQYSVAALKMGDLLWHPTCFRCTQCDDLLVDLAYCVYKDKIYCERHYAECLKPRCEGCDELIFSGEYTKAMNKDWHGQHFCCWQCDESLTGQRYVLRDDHPYCVSCYESVFANACEKCSRTIGIDSKDLSYKDKHWHEACFLCTTCGESLVDKQFGSKGERIYCGRCYDNQFASRCDGCNEIFRAGTKKMEYKTRQWHEKCFCCCVCKVPIGTQSFIPREQEIYCAKCYEEKFATRCIKCNKVITSGGVTYKNEPWHRECFTCTNCSKSLAGERFTSREDKPYCAECFGELFAKRCFACNKPITGIGGTKFISFEDRHWHNDCFFCAMCRTSLVGRGFITDQDDIICPECAKQKLL